MTVLGIDIESGIYLLKDARTIVLSLSYRMPLSIIKFFPSEMLSGVNLSHSVKAPPSIDVTELGILIDVKDEHL